MADQPSATPAVPSAPSAPSVVSSAASSAATAATTAAASASAAVTDTIQKAGLTPTLLVVGFIVVALVAFVVAYALYWLVNRVVLDKKSYLCAETKMPLNGTEYRSVVGTEVPKASNGKRLSFSFWIYLHNINQFMGTKRHIFHRGDKTGAVADSSPSVYLDANTNKIHVVFSSLDTAVRTAAASDSIPVQASKRGITIDYVPLQRWVHVAVVVNENANGGSVTAYVDGEVAKVAVTGKDYKIDGNTVQASIKDMDLDHTGDIWVGGNPAENVGPGFSGLLAKLRWFNYDINSKDVYNEYMQGPIDNMMAKLGLPAYGLRSPVYKIG